MDDESFRRFGHELVDWVADYLAHVESYPVCPAVEPGDIRRRLPTAPPEQGEPFERIMADFRDIVVPGMTHWQHPGWFAYFPANNSPPSILAELLAAGLGAQCMSWQTSPAATELEEVVLEWLRRMLGLPEGMTGSIQDTASTATLTALLVARERKSGFSVNERGLGPPLVVYASDQAHSSVEKAAKIAGFGRDRLRLVATDEVYAMRPDALERAIREDEARGLVPACAVATLGTTSTTAVDPLRDIGAICRARGLYLHVDAAFAGSAAILPEMRHILDGVELCDSFVVNPHKWLLTNFDCSAFYVRNEAELVRTFSMQPAYLRTRVDSEVRNFRDLGIPLGRRFRALKLWFVLRAYGVAGLQAMLREHLRLARIFADLVRADRRFELLAPVTFSLVCFRLNDGRPREALDTLNKRLHVRINEAPQLHLTHTELRCGYALRLAIGARTTAERHVRDAWDVIRKAAGEVLWES